MTDSADRPDHDGSSSEPPVGGPAFPSIIIQGQALARIEAEMGADTGAEFGGVLVGNAAPSTNFVLVTGSMPAAQAAPDEHESGEDPDAAGSADSSGFSFTAAGLESLARDVAATYPGQRIVGWYHSHPRSGVFLSSNDLYIQSAFFAQSWQIGYVYDPILAQRGFFGWSGREIVRVPQWEVTSMTHAAAADAPVNAPNRSASAATLIDGAPPDFAPVGSSAAVPTPSSHVGTIGATEDMLSLPPPLEVPPPPRRKRPVGAIVAAVAIVVALVIAVFALTSGDDDDTGTQNTTGDSTSSVAETGETSAVTIGSDTATTVAADPASSIASTSTTAQTASSDGTEATVVAITFPATPTAVTAPAGRVGPTAVACQTSAAATYEPVADCYVPLANGNVMVFVSGSLRCVDPDGQVLANEAQKFTIGVDDDPIVLVADDVLTPTCLNLAYARNVLAGGSEALDGLCGISGAQINDGTRRCFSQNLTTGAMIALVRSTTDQSDLVASCTTTAGDPVVSPITWSNEEVGTDWRVDSVVFDTATSQFTASASLEDATATATLSCG